MSMDRRALRYFALTGTGGGDSFPGEIELGDRVVDALDLENSVCPGLEPRDSSREIIARRAQAALTGGTQRW